MKRVYTLILRTKQLLDYAIEYRCLQRRYPIYFQLLRIFEFCFFATYFAPDFLKCHTKLQSACLAASEIQETKRHVFIALFFLAAETLVGEKLEKRSAVIDG